MKSISEQQKQKLQKIVNNLQMCIDNIGISTPIDSICALGAFSHSLSGNIEKIEIEVKA